MEPDDVRLMMFDGDTHELKTWPEPFADLVSGRKTFELRVFDRDFKVGDKLCLREWDPATETYSGRESWHGVTAVYTGWGLKDGYCALGLTVRGRMGTLTICLLGTAHRDSSRQPPDLLGRGRGHGAQGGK